MEDDAPEPAFGGQAARPAVIELGFSGRVEVADELARERYPGLEVEGLEHPLLLGLPERLAELPQATGKLRWEQRYNGTAVVLGLSYDAGNKRFRLEIEPVDTAEDT